MGAANPSDVFLPILIATFCSTLVGLIAVCIKQRINLFDKVILGTIGGLTILIGGILILFSQLPPEKALALFGIRSKLPVVFHRYRISHIGHT